MAPLVSNHTLYFIFPLLYLFLTFLTLPHNLQHAKSRSTESNLIVPNKKHANPTSGLLGLLTQPAQWSESEVTAAEENSLRTSKWLLGFCDTAKRRSGRVYKTCPRHWQEKTVHRRSTSELLEQGVKALR